MRTPSIEKELSNEEIIDMLNKRFDEIDYRSAIDDVINFIDMSEYNSIRIWCSEKFKQIMEKLSSDD